jgi:hypothetical protein
MLAIFGIQFDSRAFMMAVFTGNAKLADTADKLRS